MGSAGASITRLSVPGADPLDPPVISISPGGSSATVANAEPGAELSVALDPTSGGCTFVCRGEVDLPDQPPYQRSVSGCPFFFNVPDFVGTKK